MLQQLHNRLPWVIQPPFRWLYYRYQNRRFNELKKRANGMLSPEVYNKLYQYASNASHSNVLEIGAAHGASTIALALGLKESQYENRVITFEKGEGGSRAEYGSKEENLEIFRGNLAAYDVDDSVSIVPERLNVERGVPDIVQEHAPYSLLCIDADGKLHRDFSLLYDLLEPGAVVIIDDYSLQRDYTEVNEQHPLGGGKDYRTFCYVNHFLETGVLKELEVIDNTFFGTRSVTTEYPPEDASIDTIKAHLKNDRQRVLKGRASIKDT